MQNRLLIYGDSILKGVVLDPESGRYVVSHGIDYDAISEAYHTEICNRSKFGCTITRGEMYLDKALDLGESFDIAVLEYGGNDCDFDWRAVAAAPDAEHLPNTPIDTFRATYERMIAKVRDAGALPILTGLPPISGPRYLAQIASRGIDADAVLHWLGDAGAIYRYQERYAAVVAELAQTYNLPFADLRTPFLAVRKMETLLCDDGIHPNRDGQRIITAELARVLSCCMTTTRIAG